MLEVGIVSIVKYAFKLILFTTGNLDILISIRRGKTTIRFLNCGYNMFKKSILLLCLLAIWLPEYCTMIRLSERLYRLRKYDTLTHFGHHTRIQNVLNYSHAKDVVPRKSITNTMFIKSSVGQQYSNDYKIFFLNKNCQYISPWHNLTLQNADGTFNMIVEVPKGTREKAEISTVMKYNPITYDKSKEGEIRRYYEPIMWNYGALPQTWEDPHISLEASKKTLLNECSKVDNGENSAFDYVTCLDDSNIWGDNDPLDIVDVSNGSTKSADVVPIKVLGALCMIDGGELDWKVIGITAADSKYDLINDIDDVDIYYPGTVRKVREWFRSYKVYEGKDANKFAFDELPLNKMAALTIIKETHKAYKRLINGDVDSGRLWICDDSNSHH